MKVCITEHNITALKLFTCLLLLVYITAGCTNKKNYEIITTIDSFYRPEVAGDYRLVNKKLITGELRDLIERATRKQALEAYKMKTSGSTDKPNMIEGDIFTSVLEGSTSHKIESVFQSKSKAEVIVIFTNSNYELSSWKDRVLLKKEQGYWKINDVKYAPGKGVAGTQDVLNKFLETPPATPVN